MEALGRGAKQRVGVVRLRDSLANPAQDEVAREEALQLSLDGHPLALLLRTPGSDVQLAVGLLHAERAINSAADIAEVRVAASGQRDFEGLGIVVRPIAEAENLVDVHLRRPPPPGKLGWQHALPSSSACGICGTATLEALQQVQAPVSSSACWTPDYLYRLPDVLLQAQRVFHSTGGLHAAGLLVGPTVEMRVAEDVGRHNAVDKLLGGALLRGELPLDQACLVVSGRAGFEIVQKAAAAGVPLVASISAPSSLAVQVADATGVTLVGFLRGRRGNIYSHPERLQVRSETAVVAV